MRAVILAAGRGERLSPLTDRIPKPLVQVSGRPLLEHILITIRRAGVSECVIVTGYRGDAIRRYLGNGSWLDMDVRYAHNPRYADGNATSLKCALPYIQRDESFLLMMSDHLIEESIVKSAIGSQDIAPLLCVDRSPRFTSQINDATKVLVGGCGIIRDIGKKIPEWNGVDTGVFLLDGEVFDIIERLEGVTDDLSITRCMKELVSEGRLRACDVSGTNWFDIDTPEDLASVESFFMGGRACRKDGTELSHDS